MRLHTQSELRLFRCTFAGCDKTYARKTHLTRHLAQHGKENTYVCDEPDCDQSFVTRQKLEKHRRSHAGLRCNACGAKFRKRAKLEQHRRLKHGGRADSGAAGIEVEDQGTAPDKLAASSAAAARHTCDSCGVGFHHFRDLAAHKRQAHPKAHICDECGKAYATERGLKEHQERVHVDGAMVLCPREGCGQTFSSAPNLRVHERVFHRGLRPFTCRHCDATFAYKHVLNRHVLTHGSVVLRRPSGAVRDKADSEDEDAGDGEEDDDDGPANEGVAEKDQCGTCSVGGGPLFLPSSDKTPVACGRTGGRARYSQPTAAAAAAAAEAAAAMPAPAPSVEVSAAQTALPTLLEWQRSPWRVSEAQPSLKERPAVGVTGRACSVSPAKRRAPSVAARTKKFRGASDVFAPLLCALSGASGL